MSLSIKSHIKKIGLKWMCSREKYLVMWGSVQLSTSGMCRRCSSSPIPLYPPLTLPLWGEGILFKKSVLSRWGMSGVAPFFIYGWEGSIYVQPETFLCKKCMYVYMHVFLPENNSHWLQCTRQFSHLLWLNIFIIYYHMDYTDFRAEWCSGGAI